MRRLRRLSRPLAGVAAALIAGALVAAYTVPLPERIQVSDSPVVRYQDGSLAHVFLADDDRWRLAVDLEDVDPDYVTALIQLEDKRFYRHPGVDPIAILRAIAQNALHGEVVSGGSTITMQLVRILEPRPRTVPSKIIESLRAMQLELRLSKEEILTAYLTYTPYGRNLEGIDAASLAYFGHRSDTLSPSEITTLLAVPQNPNIRYPCADNAERLRAGRDGIAERLAALDALPHGEGQGELSEDELLDLIRNAPLPARIHPMPRQAPHASRWIIEQAPDGTQSTLDQGTQQLVERQLRQLQAEYQRRGIHNVAVVVLDHETMELRALAGNFDFFSGEGGQIASFAVPRSSGSTLKPFIYARAIDEGMVLPGFMVPDIPVHYGGYSPQNYDGTYQGLIRLDDALARSLNVPFVDLLGEVGVRPFLAQLRHSGVHSLDPDPGHYGLSAAIGGVEITPLEMAVLYATLARGGVYTPLRWEQTGLEPQPGRQVISEEAAWLTTRTLRRRDRPDFTTRHNVAVLPPRIHWKTGTSYGHRDAWAVGSDPLYTVAVWLGNLDNSPSSELVGAEAAGPLLFDILEALSDPRHHPAEGRPADLVRVKVCAYSGHLTSSACPHVRTAWALTERVPTVHCPYHVQMEVDTDSGLVVRPGCRSGRQTEAFSFVVWPSSIQRYLIDRHRLLPEPPELDPACAPVDRGRGPAITSPPAGHMAFLVPGVAADDQEVPLEADAPADSRLSWFVGGEYLGTVQASDRLWWIPSPGDHTFVVTDESGRSSTRTLAVRDRP